MASAPAPTAPGPEPATPRHVVVLGHPAGRSFNRAIADAYLAEVAANRQQAALNDLYARGFDPCLRADERPGPDYRLHAAIAAELELIRDADVLALVYPIWFGTPPAIIKGYVDRVLGADFSAEALKAGLPSPMLEGKRLAIFTTSGSSLPWLEEKGQWLALRQGFDRYLTDVFKLESCDHTHFESVVSGMPPRVAEEHLAQVRDAARAMCGLAARDRHARRAQELLDEGSGRRDA